MRYARERADVVMAATETHRLQDTEDPQSFTTRGEVEESACAGDPGGDRDSLDGQLSTTPVENDFVTRVYQRLAKVYDWFFGPTLHHGRIEAIRRMELEPGERVLEVGVGTGITASIYPRHCDVTGIDVSAEMLEKARERVGRKGLGHVRLFQMDAAHLEFPDDSFDVVHAAYVMSVVADPLRVAREMVRVCRPGGRVVFLNHFRSTHPVMAALERAISPLTVHIGFKSDLDLDRFLDQAGLEPVSVEKVNFPRLWSLVTCVTEAPGQVAEAKPGAISEGSSEAVSEAVSGKMPERVQPSGGSSVLQG